MGDLRAALYSRGWANVNKILHYLAIVSDRRRQAQTDAAYPRRKRFSDLGSLFELKLDGRRTYALFDKARHRCCHERELVE